MFEYLRSLGDYFVAQPLKLIWVVVTLIFLIFITASLLKSSIKGNNLFNLTHLFLDPKSNKISDSKFRMNIAFLATTWVLTYLAISDTLTEWFLIGYLTAWVIDRANSRYSYNKRLSVSAHDLIDEDSRSGRNRRSRYTQYEEDPHDDFDDFYDSRYEDRQPNRNYNPKSSKSNKSSKSGKNKQNSSSDESVNEEFITKVDFDLSEEIVIDPDDFDNNTPVRPAPYQVNPNPPKRSGS